MFSRTSWERLDFSTTTLLSLMAVCILRTFDWLLGFSNHNSRLLVQLKCTHTHTRAQTHTGEDLQILPLPEKQRRGGVRVRQPDRGMTDDGAELTASC